MHKHKQFVWKIAVAAMAVGLLAGTQRSSAQVAASSQTVITSGVGNATGVAVDSLGNLYIDDGGNGLLLSSQGSNATPGTLLSGLTAPGQIAIDAVGNIYVANGTSNQVVKIPYQSGLLNVNGAANLGTGLGTLTGVAVDLSGNVYAVDATNKQVVKIVGTSQTIITTALTAPKQIAIDRLGNIYIADAGANKVVYLPVGGGAASTVGTGLNAPSGVATDAANNIYIADTGNGRVLQIPSVAGVPSTTVQNVLTTTITAPTSLALDSQGSLYVASAGSVYRYTGGSIYFALLPVGTTSQTFPVTLNFTAAITPATIKVLTTGITGLDYKDAGNDTCVAGSYSVGNTCTVNVTFTPAGVGPRYGAIVLYDANNKVLSRIFLGGAGMGPLMTIDPGTLTSVTPTVNAAAPFNVLTTPHGIITDAGGNIFLAETGYTTTGTPPIAYPARILEIPAGTTTANVIATQSNNGISINGAGDLIVATGGATVLLYPNENGTLNPADTITLGSGYSRARVAKSDVGGNIFWCDASGNALYEQQIPAAIAAIAPTKTVLTGLTTSCLGVAVDLYGNLAIGDGSTGKVLYDPISGATPYETGSGFAGAWGVTFDASGSVWMGSSTTSILGRIPNENGTLVGADQTLSTVDAVKAFDIWMDDTSGTLYTTVATGNQIASFNVLNRLNSTHAFATTAIGATTASTPYILTDSGNQPPVYSNGGTIGLFDTLDFPSVTSASPACNFSLPLAVGFSCDLAFAFSPQSSGLRKGTVQISSDAISNAMINFTGTATGTAGTAATVAIVLTSPTVSPAPGQPLVFTATVTPSGTAAATGPLTIYVDGTATGSSILASNAATFSVPAGLALGSHTIGVTYAGDKSNAAITTPATTTVTVVAAGSTTTLVASGTDIAVNQSIALSATVPSITGLKLASGTVTFKDTTTNLTLGTGTLNASGVASINASFAATGAHAIQATYAGDPVYGGSTSKIVTVTVGAFAATTTTLAVTPAQPVGGYVFGTTLTAAVAVAAQTGTGTPTGAMDLLLDGAPVSVGIVLTSGKATVSLSSISAGAHILTAYYSGDTTYSTSASTGYSFMVVKAVTATTLSISSTANYASALVTLKATVSNVNVTSATPSGSVTFLSGKGSLGTVALSGGSATLNTPLLPAGTDSITAVYQGDANDLTSTSAAMIDVVTLVPSTLTLTTAPSVLVSGGTTVLTATIVGAPITGSFSGTVTFSTGTTTLAVVNVSSGGVATYTTAAITAPVTTYTASYSGSPVYTSSAAPGPVTVYTTDAGGAGVIATASLGSGLSSTTGTAVDISGNLYIADGTKGTVALVAGGAGSQTTVLSGLTTPGGLATDGSGNLYIANGTVGHVTEIPSTSNTLSVSGAKQLGTGLGTLTGVAVDGAGNVYAADTTNKQLVKIPATGAQTVLNSTLINPQQVAVDSLGDVYVADGTGNRVVYISAAGTTTTVGTGLLNPTGVTVDVYNNAYIADTGNNRVVKIPFVSGGPSTPGQSTLIPSVPAPGQLAIDRHLALSIGQGTSIFKWQSNAATFGVLTPGLTSPVYTLTVTFPTAITPAAINVLTAGLPSSEYNLTGGTCKAGTSYTAGQSCTLTITFTPASTAGVRPGAVTFTTATGQPLLTTYLGGVLYAPSFNFDNPTYPLNKGLVIGTGTVNGAAVGALRGIAVDALNNVYICDNGNARVLQTNLTGSTATVLYTGTGCTTMAVDGAGNLIVDDMGNNRMILLPNENGTINGSDAYVVATGFSGPRGMSLDGFGNIYVADTTNVRVVVAPIGGATTTQAIPTISNIKSPYDVAVDWQGNIAVADTTLAQIAYLPANGTGPTVVGPPLCGAFGVAMDNAGAIFASETGTACTTGTVTPGSDVVRITPGSSFYELPDGHASGPYAVSLDAQGNLYTLYGSNFVVNNRSTLPLGFSSAVGATSAAQAAIVSNSGPAPATFTNSTGTFYLDSLDFAVTAATTQPCNYTSPLAAAGACELGILFNPVQAGTRTAFFTPSANQVGQGFLALTGSATATATPKSTTIALAVSNPASGKPFPATSFTLTSTLSGGSGTATGTVSLAIDGAYVAQQKVAATVNFVLSAGLSLGYHTAVVTYSGDASNATSTVSLLVSVAGVTGSSTTLSVSPLTLPVLIPFGSPTCAFTGGGPLNTCASVTMTAVVTGSPTGAAPTNVVEFEDSGVVLGTARLNAAGIATFVYNGVFYLGTHQLTANYVGDLTYAASTSAVQSFAAVYPGDYTLGLNQTSLSLKAGDVASIAIAATPVTGLPNGFYKGQIGLTCTGLPIYATCAVSPNTLYLDGTGVAAAGTLSIITQAGFVHNEMPFSVSTVRLCMLPVMSLLMLLGAGTLRRRRLLMNTAARNLLVFVALAGLLSSLVACGSHSALAPKSGTYTVTLSGAGTGSVNHTVTMQVTIQ
jgi:sugar lactone lactonase YvrE